MEIEKSSTLFNFKPNPIEKDPARVFEEFEKNLFKQVQPLLPCVHCENTGSIISNGVTGNVDSRGIRRISLFCKKCSGPTFRFQAALQKANHQEALEALDNAAAAVPVEPSVAKRSTKITLIQRPLSFSNVANKRVRANSPSGMVQDAEDSTNALLREMVERERDRANRAEEWAAELRVQLRELRSLLEALQPKQLEPTVSTAMESELNSYISRSNAPKQAKSATKQPPIGSGVDGRKVPGLDSDPKVTELTANINESTPWTKVVSRKHSKSAGSAGINKIPLANTAVVATSRTAQQITSTQQARASNQQATRMRHKCNKAVEKLLAPKREPLEFRAIRIRVHDTRPIRDIKGKERQRILQETAKTLGIQEQTALISTIGNSIIEFYVPAGDEATVRKRLEDRKMDIVDGVNVNHQPPHAKQSKEACIETRVKRLTHMCLVAKTRNLQETILEGADQDLRDAVLQRYRKIVDEPDATIGRIQTPSVTEQSMETDEIPQ